MTSVGCHDGVMDLSPYIDGLQRDLAASAAPGGPDVTRAAELLGGSLEASARLCLLEALSEAAAEITSRLRTATVDVRLRGREADLTVTEIAPAADPVPPMPPMPPTPPGAPDGGADPARSRGPIAPANASPASPRPDLLPQPTEECASMYEFPVDGPVPATVRISS